MNAPRQTLPLAHTPLLIIPCHRLSGYWLSAIRWCGRTASHLSHSSYSSHPSPRPPFRPSLAAVLAGWMEDWWSRAGDWTPVRELRFGDLIIFQQYKEGKTSKLREFRGE